MKKTLVWRFITIGVILLVWGWSLFPLTDKPFYDVFRKEAKDKVDSTFEEIIEQAKTIDNSNEGSFVTPAKAVLIIANEKKVDLRDYIPIYDQPDASNSAVVNYVRRRAAGKLKLGLDLRGGTEFIIAFDEDELKESDPDKKVEEARSEIIEIVRNRVDQSGLVEAQIQPIGPTTISLKIPSIDADDVHSYRKIVEATAKLDFRLVHENNASIVNQEGTDGFVPPVGYERMELRETGGADEPDQILYVKQIPERISGRHIKRALRNISEFGGNSVSLEFNFEGANLFHQLTKDSVGRRLAIVLDGTIYSAPNINEPISGGRAEITGNFTQEEAENLSIVLRCGNLPVPIKIEGEFSTDPTLGKDSVKSGAYAAIGGLILVMFFMTIYYFSAGIVADLALTANILLVLGTLTIAGATITLPGIAGIVLTIGMAIDANVLIFERIREELANKKSLANAVHTGYSRAFSTIMDANLTTLFAAAILYYFGSGPIRGFAVTLSFGIFASLFTALFMTRAVFDLMIIADWIKNVRMLSLFKFNDIDFMRFRKITTVFSVLLILGSLGALIFRGKSAFGVDFMGGTAITFNYKEEIPPSDIRKALEKKGFEDVRVSYKMSVSQDTQLMELVLAQSLSSDTDTKSEIKDYLNGLYPNAEFSKGTTQFIGGLVGKRFAKQAMWAFLWGVVGIIIYITFRFEFGYAMGAVTALIHDIVICTGIFLVANMGERQLSLPVIAALLTIMGYSLNDTIVVFDRIRENLGLIKKTSFIDIINMSINHTLSRTMLTSLTTLFVVVTLYLFGGGAINDFALIMLIGVIVGSYSSIFVASPVMLFWHNRKQREKNPATTSSSLAKSAV